MKSRSRHLTSYDGVSPNKSANGVSSSRSRTPQRKTPDKDIPILKHFPKFVPYMQIQKIKLNRQKQANILQRLQYEEKSRKGYAARLKKDELFVDYNYNNFLQEGHKHKKTLKEHQKNQIFSHSNPKSPRPTSISNKKSLLSGVAQLKNKDIFPQFLQRAQQMPPDMIALHKKMLGSFQKAKQLSKIQQNAKKQAQKQIQKQIQKKNQKKMASRIQQEFDWLDSLVASKEESSIQQDLKNRQMNIFMFLKNPNHPMFQTQKDQMIGLRFCQDSIVRSQKNTYVDEAILKDISFISRLNITKKNHQVPSEHKVQPHFVLGNMDKLQMRDMMQLASGFFTPKDVRLRLDNVHLTQNEQIKLIARKKQINYRQNDMSKPAEYLYHGTAQQQIKQYKQTKLSQEQNSQKKLSQFYIQKLMDIFKVHQKSTMDRVNDVSLHIKLIQNQKNILKQHFDNNPKNKQQFGNINRKIWQNKNSKSRIQNLHIHAVREAVNVFKQKRKNIKQNINKHIKSCFE